ncbi:hypothetical protein [Desulfotomaculum copahuensis]|uniref:Prenylated flavin chaperone LpdD-like domain-containing protein n=1 Tax=Desulfotomaculum copahuensis TaxID=1838280 RepID=A0A1B7LH71_9FIRM|nr:hypothetical protein [Desulfotomaculum copahuensis]OAT85497.1 hypothetical protein A6M21_06175 [Desulfotomaculum copahuensis]
MPDMLSFQAGEGKYRVQLTVTLTGDGIILQLLGGEKPHLGAVVLSVPRPSLAVHAGISCNSTVVPRLGHKDDEVAKPVAEMVAVATGQPVSVSAGLHIEKATEREINLLRENCRRVAAQLLEFLRRTE